jgi:hypothetical protein
MVVKFTSSLDFQWTRQTDEDVDFETADGLSSVYKNMDTH